MNEHSAAIKLRGLPFEPEKIVSALKEHPQVNQASTELIKDRNGRDRLVAFVVLTQYEAASIIDLRTFSRTKLYPQLVPDFFVIHTAERKPDLGQVRINMEEQGFTPPRDATDILLLEIWTDLLGKKLGIDNDFFIEGGHSLLAVDMLSRIEKATGQSLPLSTMLTSTTIRALADALVQGVAPAVEGDIIELHKGRGGRPLFFLHGDYTGGGFFSREIAQSSDLDGPFLNVQPYGLGRTHGLELPESIEAMAAAHLEAIRLKQPTGPYRLAGHCNGGVIAYEIAQQLRKSGETIEFLGMVDPIVIDKAAINRFRPATAETDDGQQQNTAELSAPLNEEQYRRKLLRHYLGITAEYEPGAYDEPVSIILLSEKRANDPESIWAKVAKQCDIQRIDAKSPDHLTAIQQNAATVGKILSSSIADLQKQ